MNKNHPIHQSPPRSLALVTIGKSGEMIRTVFTYTETGFKSADGMNQKSGGWTTTLLAAIGRTVILLGTSVVFLGTRIKALRKYFSAWIGNRFHKQKPSR